MSIWNTRFSRWAQVIAMDGMYAGFAGAKTGHGGMAFGRCFIFRVGRSLFLMLPLPRPAGVIIARCLLLGAKTP